MEKKKKFISQKIKTSKNISENSFENLKRISGENPLFSNDDFSRNSQETLSKQDTIKSSFKSNELCSPNKKTTRKILGTKKKLILVEKEFKKNKKFDKIIKIDSKANLNEKKKNNLIISSFDSKKIIKEEEISPLSRSNEIKSKNPLKIKSCENRNVLYSIDSEEEPLNDFCNVVNKIHISKEPHHISQQNSVNNNDNLFLIKNKDTGS